MALQITTNINVDFYDNKYVMINAKQYDDRSRLISITCYNQGNPCNLSNNNHTAYIKYRKADGRWVLNCCTINYRGQVLVELTEQMLAASGICYVDLFIVNKGSAIVNIDTGSIVTIDGSSVLTTKAFYIDVQEAVVDNSLIESSDEYNGLTDLISMAEAEYGEVIQSAKSYAIGTGNTARENDENDNSKYYSKVSKSWAVGDTGVRTGEDTDNAKYYGEQAHASADAADESEAKALSYMNTAKSHKDDAEVAQSKSETAQSKAESAQSAAETAQSKAEAAQNAAEVAQQKAETAQSAAETAEQNAEQASQAAQSSETNAKLSETNSLNNVNLAMSYAVGGTSTRENEDIDNAKYYYELANNIADSLNSNIATVDEVKSYLDI